MMLIKSCSPKSREHRGILDAHTTLAGSLKLFVWWIDTAAAVVAVPLSRRVLTGFEGTGAFWRRHTREDAAGSNGRGGLHSRMLQPATGGVRVAMVR